LLSQVINHLLQCGSHVEARDKLNNTPLHNAAMNGQKQAVMALLHGGASCSSKVDAVLCLILIG
jgi:ankyrin repeat protein